MSEIQFRAELERLAVAAHMLAAVGAALRLRRDGLAAPPAAAGLLDEAVHQAGVPALESLGPRETERFVAVIDFHLRHALELFANPSREPLWSHGDPDLLEAQGVMSRSVVPMIAAAAASRPDLTATISGPGPFLDVGTGVGWIAIEAARAWPAMRVVGIDIHGPALEGARRNVALAGLSERVEIRHQDALALDERASYALAWVPAPFFSDAALAEALAKVREALVPGGWLVCGLEAPPADAAARTLAALRLVRGGGSLRTPDQVVAAASAGGLVDIETVPSGPLALILARRPFH